MGCDIHLGVEVRKKGKWVSVDKWEKEKDDGRTYVSVDYDKRFYGDRNYDLFSILADVRNGYGFAGVPTGEGFKPIAKPRGIPRDASPEMRAWAKQWGVDGHSHSYVTLKELLEFDWDGQTTLQMGVIPASMYEEFAKTRRQPESYCGAVWGQGIVTLSEDDYLNTLGDGKSLVGGKMATALKEAKINVSVKWINTYRQAVGEKSELFTKTIPRLKKLGKPEDVRIVFFFDN